MRDSAKRFGRELKRNGVSKANVTITGATAQYQEQSLVTPETGRAYRIRVTPRRNDISMPGTPVYEEAVTGGGGVAHRKAGKRADEIRALLEECGVQAGRCRYLE
ncbi:MAG: hypothetical protein ABEI97_03225 [Candidatus Nanohaloarchaea archaeon]